jgi:hypothetical protein
MPSVLARRLLNGIRPLPRTLTKPLMNGRTRIIEDLIARYIAAHPHAADTVNGIRDWWVAPDLPGTGRADVQEAIDQLVARGTLGKSDLPEGTLFYAAVAPKNGHSV